MKRIITFLLVAFSISLLTWGQESSSNISKSPLIGEWTGIYERYRYNKNGECLSADTKCVLRITQEGNQLVVRGKDLEPTGEFIMYWSPLIVTAVSDSTINFYADNSYQFTFVFTYKGGNYAELELIKQLRQENNRTYWHQLPKPYRIPLYLNDNW